MDQDKTENQKSTESNGSQKPSNISLWQGVSVLVIGLGIGWLAGLTVASVTSSILVSLLGLASGVVVGLQTVYRKKEGEEKKEPVIDARPAALLILGIALAAPLGIMARTHQIFEPLESKSVQLKPQTTIESQAGAGVLFSQYNEDCEIILGLATGGNYTAFLGELKESNIPFSKEMAERFKDEPEALAYLLRIVCQHYVPK